MKTRTYRYLSLATLREHDACQGQYDRAAKLADARGRIRVTEKRCVALASSFYWYWAAWKLLSAPARAYFERVTVAAQAAAWAKYNRGTTAVQAGVAQGDYDRVKATAFARAYLADKGVK